MSVPSVSPGQTGFDLYGYLTAAVGLGVAARNTATALAATGRTVRAIDITSSAMGSARAAAIDALIRDSAGLGAQPANVFHINPDQLRYMIAPWKRAYGIGVRPSVCVPFWEASRLPRSWVRTLEAMDIIMAPSLFIRDAVRADLPSANIIHYPQAAPLPAGITADRARWGIPEGVVAFVSSFAFASDVERKNPWAVLEAFDAAFGADPARMLVVKSTRPAPGTPGFAAYTRLRDMCDSRVNVRLIDDALSYPDVLSLYASCDVLVSLHRSEGLGLSMLEAMGLGVAVIATGWSGNMDFMTPENSACVAYRLVDVDVPPTSPYHPSRLGMLTRWAEPDIGDAAAWMRRMADDRRLRDRFVSAGRETAQQAEAAFMSAHPWDLVDDILHAGAPGADTRRAAILHLERTYLIDYAARIARGAARRLGRLTGAER